MKTTLNPGLVAAILAVYLAISGCTTISTTMLEALQKQQQSTSQANTGQYQAPVAPTTSESKSVVVLKSPTTSDDFKMAAIAVASNLGYKIRPTLGGNEDAVVATKNGLSGVAGTYVMVVMQLQPGKLSITVASRVIRTDGVAGLKEAKQVDDDFNSSLAQFYNGKS